MKVVVECGENLRDRPIRAVEDNELLLSAAAGDTGGKGCAPP
jgi:hypothetical protein